MLPKTSAMRGLTVVQLWKFTFQTPCKEFLYHQRVSLEKIKKKELPSILIYLQRLSFHTLLVPT